MFSLLAHELVDIIVGIRRNFRDEVIHFKVIMISGSKMDKKVTGIVTKFAIESKVAPELATFLQIPLEPKNSGEVKPIGLVRIKMPLSNDRRVVKIYS